jgi:hypothetical protein
MSVPAAAVEVCWDVMLFLRVRFDREVDLLRYYLVRRNRNISGYNKAFWA